MRRPKSLYRYNSLIYGEKKIEKHRITTLCCPQIEINAFNSRGHLWRCRCEGNDFYGYDNIADAKREEIENTRLRIYEDQQWLKKLTFYSDP